MKLLASAALFAFLEGCATPRPEQMSSIAVTLTPTYAICAGYCPNLTAVVREDGKVAFSRRGPAHLQVTRQQASEFMRILGSYRSAEREAGPATCEFWKSADTLVLKTYPYQLIWRDADGETSTLRSCGDPRLQEAIRQAFWSIGRYMGGEAIARVGQPSR